MVCVFGNNFLFFLACFLLILRNSFIDIRSKPAYNLEKIKEYKNSKYRNNANNHS